MHSSDIAARASFDHIRYAQLWEDADVLTEALGDQRGGTLVSICSAGDNALAMLVLDPARVVVVDLSPAQIACLRLRMGAFRALDHAEFLELMGARPSERRKALLARATADLDPETAAHVIASLRALQAQGRTLLIASHDPALIAAMDRELRL